MSPSARKRAVYSAVRLGRSLFIDAILHNRVELVDHARRRDAIVT